MPDDPLLHKTVLITGAARRLGRRFALACAHAGADVIIHHAHSDSDAESLRAEISRPDRQAWVFQQLHPGPGQTGLQARLNLTRRLSGLNSPCS